MTYKEDTLIVYDAHKLKSKFKTAMPIELMEGWGLTHSDYLLWASDGTD